MSTKLTPEIIAAAIEGFESQKRHLDAQISELRAMLDGGQPRTAAPSERGTRRRMSAAGRRRIAEAQRQRWAAANAKAVSAKSEPTRPSRRLSAAGRAAIVAALKKRWALKRAAEQKSQPLATNKRATRKAVVRRAA